MPLYANSFLWLSIEFAQAPFQCPEDYHPLIAGVDARGRKMYLVSQCMGHDLLVVTEGKPVRHPDPRDEPYEYFVLVLAFEPSVLLDKYGPVPDYGLDPTGPFYWRPAHTRQTPHITEVSSQDSTDGYDSDADCESDSGDEADGSEWEEESTDSLSGGEDDDGDDSDGSDDGGGSDYDGYNADISRIFEVGDAESDGADG